MQSDLTYEVVHYKENEWAAEANDLASGDCYRVLFIGPDAETRSHEFARWNNASVGAPTA